MPDTQREITTAPTLIGHDPLALAHGLLKYAAHQQGGDTVAGDKVQAISTLLGANVMAQTLLEGVKTDQIDVTLDDTLRVSEVQLRDLGKTTLSAVLTEAPDVTTPQAVEPVVAHTPLAPITAAAKLAQLVVDRQDSPIESTPLSDTPEELPLEGVPARVAIRNLLHNLGGGIDKGRFRSAGLNIYDLLKSHGHTYSAVNQARKVLVAEGVISLTKKTPKSKIIEAVQLVNPPESQEVPQIAPTQPEEEPAQLDEEAFTALLKRFPGKANQSYILALKEIGGAISVKNAHDVLMTRILDVANASVIQEDDRELGEAEIFKAQRTLHNEGVIEIVREDPQKPNRVTGISFNKAEILKKKKI